MKKTTVYICLLMAVFNHAVSQPFYRNKHAGFNVGLVSSFGTHFQRFGVSLHGYYVYNFVQVHSEIRLYDNFKNLGPGGEYAELSTTMGLVVGYGNKHKEFNRFLSPVSNQTKYNNSVGYSYTFWFNHIKTQQQTGMFSLQFRRFSLISENDLFARPILDRFRTGAMLLQYQDKHIQYGINCTMWTGQLDKVNKGSSHYPNGYIDTTGGRYTQYSAGLLSLQVKYADAYGQFYQANAGIDAEQIRNFFQNKMIHDVLPNNYTIPMLDTTGNQYLFNPGQKIRKPNAYINFHTSPAMFY